MKFYLLDVNTITAPAQLNPITIQRAKNLQPGDEMITCFVVVGEWEYGIRNAPGVKRQREIKEQGAKIFGSLFDIVESSPEINITWRDFRRTPSGRRYDSSKRYLDRCGSACNWSNSCYKR